MDALTPHGSFQPCLAIDNIATPVAEPESKAMTVVGMGQRRFLNVNVGFRGASSVRSGRANLNNFLSGNSGHKVRPWTAGQTGVLAKPQVIDGEEISAAQPAHSHARIQGAGGPCRFA
jgi:hypothetical protein